MMQNFAALLDTLAYTSSTLAKRRLMAEFFLHKPDPERGWALGALAGDLTFPVAKPNLIRELVSNKVDPVLLALSRDYVGDMAETIALIWPEAEQPAGKEDDNPPSLDEVIDTLNLGNRATLQARIEHWLNVLDANGRWALLKLVTGNIRVGVSARLAKTALADAFGKEVDEIEQIWHGVEPPYLSLFAWLEGKAEAPAMPRRAFFLPMMLAHPLEESEFAALNLDDYQMELKWDGIRIQLVRSGDQVAIYTRTGDDISHTFPDMVRIAEEVEEEEFVLDGELLVVQEDSVASFNALQQRLNRKNVSAAMLSDYPAHIRLYDILVDHGEDVRPLPLSERRKRLEAWHARHQPPRTDLSPILGKDDHEALRDIRTTARAQPEHGIEGLMIKRLASPYLAGRPRGHWFKWKHDTLILDCVMMYAQRGSGKRSSFYSDYTFGVWEGDMLVPIGKAYSGFTDAELTKLDKFVRANTVKRFGPVREVTPHLVLEVEFDSIHPSPRHKSGLAMRFPRIHRIRWDKPANEADTIETARRLVA